MNNDTISRRAAIDALMNSVTPYGLIDDDGNIESVCKDKDVIAMLYSLPSAEPEIIRCKECKYFEYDKKYVVLGVPVLGHEVCNAWADGCKTNENGYCFLAKRRTDNLHDD